MTGAGEPIDSHGANQVRRYVSAINRNDCRTDECCTTPLCRDFTTNRWRTAPGSHRWLMCPATDRFASRILTNHRMVRDQYDRPHRLWILPLRIVVNYENCVWLQWSRSVGWRRLKMLHSLVESHQTCTPVVTVTEMIHQFLEIFNQKVNYSTLSSAQAIVGDTR